MFTSTVFDNKNLLTGVANFLTDGTGGNVDSYSATAVNMSKAERVPAFQAQKASYVAWLGRGGQDALAAEALRNNMNTHAASMIDGRDFTSEQWFSLMDVTASEQFRKEIQTHGGTLVGDGVAFNFNDIHEASVLGIDTGMESIRNDLVDKKLAGIGTKYSEFVQAVITPDGALSLMPANMGELPPMTTNLFL